MEERTQDYRLVTTAEDLAAVAKTLQSAEAIGVDIETTALSPLTEVLEGGPIKVGHNLKFDYQFLHAVYGILLSPLFDTMLAAQVLDGGNYAPSYSLEAVVERYLDESLDKSQQRSDWS